MYVWWTRWTDAYRNFFSVKICCVQKLNWNLTNLLCVCVFKAIYETTATLVFWWYELHCSFFVYCVFGTLERHNLSARGRFQLIWYARSIQIRKYIHCLLNRFHFLFWAYTMSMCVCFYFYFLCVFVNKPNQQITIECWNKNEQDTVRKRAKNKKSATSGATATASTSMHTSICHCDS